MTDINALRERVEAAEQRFGLMDEQQRHYSERVIGLALAGANQELMRLKDRVIFEYYGIMRDGVIVDEKNPNRRLCVHLSFRGSSITTRVPCPGVESTESAAPTPDSYEY